MNSLVVFEASARHLSFTRAAQELAISREAVSRQIRNLEEFLGAPLFLRLYRALELTPAGETLFDSVRRGLLDIAAVSRSIQRPVSASKLTITATHAIASHWLPSPLRKFRSEFPDTEVQVIVSDEPLDLIGREIDVGLWYGDGAWPDVESIFLFEGETFPVCSPAYLERSDPIAEPNDLLNHTLLNLEGSSHATEDWFWWLDRAGVRPSVAPHILRVNTYNVLIQEALAGQGIGLGFGGILDELMNQGRLVKPLNLSFNRGRAVYMTLPKGAPRRSEVERFAALVKRQAKPE
jgi:LysR family glycine cleavage system transcriptional activator